MKVKQTRILKRGFTLIEMMVVVAIIAILAVIGLPYYQEYTQRAKLMEAVKLTAGLRIAYEEEYAAGNLPLWGPDGNYTQRNHNDPVLIAAMNRLKARAATLQGKYVERVEISNLQRSVILVYFKDGSHSTRSGS
mgnify:CR=1 FL=1